MFVGNCGGLKYSPDDFKLVKGILTLKDNDSVTDYFVAPMCGGIKLDSAVFAPYIVNGKRVIGRVGETPTGYLVANCSLLMDKDKFELDEHRAIKTLGGGGEVNYLCFTANTAGSTIGMTDMMGGASGFVPDLETSTDGQNWTPFVAGTDTITLANVGDKVYFRGDNPDGLADGEDYAQIFTMTGSIAASGDTTSIISKDGGVATLPDMGLMYLFYNCTSLTLPPELPSTSLGNMCYGAMFYNCTSLTTAPALPATTLGNMCYYMMFRGCTSLTTAPALPATTLSVGCYYSMFVECTSLTSAPSILPATTLANNCYEYMFSYTALTTAPILPATVMTQNCYMDMFRGCTALTTAPNILATTIADGCWSEMFYGCTSLNYIKIAYVGNFGSFGGFSEYWVNAISNSGDFYYNGSDTTRSTSAIPNGWTVHTF